MILQFLSKLSFFNDTGIQNAKGKGNNTKKQAIQKLIKELFPEISTHSLTSKCSVE